MIRMMVAGFYKPAGNQSVSGRGHPYRLQVCALVVLEFHLDFRQALPM